MFATRFIGREDEIAAVCSLLDRIDVRLLTMVGPPGIGKTRFTLEVARHVAPRFKHRAAFADLSTVSDAALIPHTIARALGLADAPRRTTLKRLIDVLADQHLLLVLDNFEHVIDGAVQVAEILSFCSGVKVMATSRQALHLTWERAVPVAPLQVPDLRQLPPIEALERYSGVALFLERARALQPDLSLTPQNAQAIAQICFRLDGLPLAIEMAAARVRSMTPEVLARRLDDRLGLLAAGVRDVPTRQRTLRSAIAWSYDLLQPAEQTLFRRFAVFSGGGTAEAARAVCSRDLGVDVVEDLAALVDRSLLRHNPQSDGTSRFTMLESVREFGLEKLSAAGELEATRGRHGDFFVALAQEAETCRDSVQSRWMESLEREHANFQAVLGWCLSSGNIASGLQLATALSWFWNLRGYWGVGRSWTERLLKVPYATEDGLRARGLSTLGELLWHQAEYEQAQAVLEESLATFRRLDDPIGVIDVLYLLGELLQWREEYDRANETHREGLALSRDLHNAIRICRGLTCLSGIAINRGEYGFAFGSLREALGIAQDLGLERGRGLILYDCGRLAFFQGQLNTAAARYRECLAIFHQIESTWDVARTVVRLGDVAAWQDDGDSAARCYEEGLAELRELGDVRWISRPLRGMAVLAVQRRQYEQAQLLLRESLHCCVESEAKFEIIDCLETAATLAAAVGQTERAGRLYGAFERLRQAIGAVRPPVMRAEHTRLRNALRRNLGDQAFVAAVTAGRTMLLEDVVAMAMAVNVSPARSPMSGRSSASLTRREEEVAALIAQGHTNRQIAAALFISEHTVESHVEHILNKLGANARTQIAAWASVNRPTPTA